MQFFYLNNAVAIAVAIAIAAAIAAANTATATATATACAVVAVVQVWLWENTVNKCGGNPIGSLKRRCLTKNQFWNRHYTFHSLASLAS